MLTRDFSRAEADEHGCQLRLRSSGGMMYSYCSKTRLKPLGGWKLVNLLNDKRADLLVLE